MVCTREIQGERGNLGLAARTARLLELAESEGHIGRFLYGASFQENQMKSACMLVLMLEKLWDSRMR